MLKRRSPPPPAQQETITRAFAKLKMQSNSSKPDKARLQQEFEQAWRNTAKPTPKEPRR